LKAELLRDTLPARSAAGDDRLILINGVKHFPAGSIIDHPDAYMLVKMGTAKPADAECTAAAGMTSEQQAVAQRMQVLVAKGIHPDDYQAYFDGQMIGYDANGDWLPGPNYTDQYDDEDDDE